MKGNDTGRIRFGGMRTPRGYLFELTGGSPCLDLANTRDERRTDRPRELLADYGDVVGWAVQAGAIPPPEGVLLRARAKADPAAAARALARLVSAREVIFGIFSATAARRPVATALLDALNALAAGARSRRRLERVRGGFAWIWRPADRADLDRPLWVAVLSATDLLTSADLRRVRECGGEGCAWLFIDTSKNGSRRWCDMSVCGNRAKARRHRKRVAAAGRADPSTRSR